MQLCGKTFITLTTVACVAAGGMALAESGNNAAVLQETTEGAAVGNSLSIDQSGATGSTVAGVTRNGTDPIDNANTISLEDEEGDQPDATEFLSLEDPLITFNREGSATQSGSGNTADIEVTGIGTEVGLFQDGIDNEGTITAGSGQILLYQEGDGNTGTLTTEDGAARASLLQDGNGNTASVEVSGLDTQGLLAQIGDGNETELNVATQGATVSFTVDGNNTSASLPASVVSNAGGGQITIIQRSLGGQ